jgi:DNA polymerase-3 subunit delta
MSPAQFLAKLKRDIPKAVLFLGSEGYIRGSLRDALIQAHVGEATDDSVTHHDLSGSSWREVLDDARAMSLFASERLIRVTSAEAALPRMSAGADDDEGGSAAAGSLPELAAYLQDPTPGVVLLVEATRFALEGEEKKKAERVRKFYAAVAEVVEFEPYSRDEAQRELGRLASAGGIQFGPGAADMLVEALGGEMSRIATETQKLALFATATHQITVDDITALIPDARSNTIFALVSAMGRRDRNSALQVLDTLCRDGEYLPLALSFLSTQMRLALVAKEAGLRSAQQVQGHFSRSGVAMWPQRAEQVCQTVNKFSLEQLKKGLRLIYTADKQLRDTRPDDRVVLETFVVELMGEN